MNLNVHKLANVRKGIMNKKRLTDSGLREIKEKIIADMKDIDSGNVGISGCGMLDAPTILQFNTFW